MNTMCTRQVLHSLQNAASSVFSQFKIFITLTEFIQKYINLYNMKYQEIFHNKINLLLLIMLVQLSIKLIKVRVI